MKRQHFKEAGGAHVFLIILVVVLLIGLLGYMFYQNFMNKPVAEQPKAGGQTSSSLLTTRFAYGDATYALDYPKGWSEAALDPGSDVKDMTISNPDRSIEVMFNVSPGGLGGMCDTTDGLKVRYYHVSDWKNTKLTSQSLRFVEAMTDYPEGGYKYVIGLSPEGAETHSSEGDSHCTVGYVGVASRVAVSPSGEVEKPTIIARILFPKLPDAADARVKSMDIVKDIMKTDDYKAAVKILESARKE